MKWLKRLSETLFETKECTCGEDVDSFLGDSCMGCFHKRVREREIAMEAAAKEQRIEELAQALRRAFPQGPYR